MATPIIDLNQQDTSLENQKLALRQRIISLKEELVAVETTQAQTSEQRVLVQAQLKAKKEERAMLRDQLLNFTSSTPWWRKSATDLAQSNLEAEWSQLKDLLSWILDLLSVSYFLTRL